MKISTQGNSRFLSHDDVRTPIVAVMDHVTEDRSLRNPYVLHFADSRLKPLPLNVTNRRTIVAAFGDDDAAWHGREIELYYNASIPNPRNPAQPGGICVRIPTGPGRNDSNRSASPPVQKPSSPPSAPKPSPPAAPKPAAAAGAGTKALAMEKTQAIQGIQRSTAIEHLERWGIWIANLKFDEADRAALAREYKAARDRIRKATAPVRRQPATA